MSISEPNLLADFPLFRGLTPKQVAWITERLRYRTFPAGTNVITVEQPGEVVYFVLKGTVKIHVEQAGGSDVIFNIVGRGDIIGEMSLLEGGQRSASVITLEEATLLWMDRHSFIEALRIMPELSLNLLRTLSARLRLSNEMFQALSTLDVYGRIAHQLLMFANKYGCDNDQQAFQIPLRLTQGDIAELVGASRKRVNQVMVSFKRQGIISVDDEGRVTILQAEALARFSR